jgi:integrase
VPCDAGRRGQRVLPRLRAANAAFVFPAAGDPTKHLAPASLYKVFYKAREEAGRPDLRFHDLRHTGAVLAASTGATLAELMARLGTRPLVRPFGTSTPPRTATR